MKKLRLYVDTSVLGGIFDTEEPKRVNTAEKLLRLISDGTYEGDISRLTIEEVFAAPGKILKKLQPKIANSGFSILEENTESINLADGYVNAGAIPG